MTKNICPCCGRKIPRNLPCSACLERERYTETYEEPAVRPYSSRRPYRLEPAHDVAMACLPVCERRQRRAALQHFQDCRTCQSYDRFYWALDPADSRFEAWCHLLWSNGLVQPTAIYEVTRFKRIPPSFTTWKATFHGSDHDALRSYLAEREEIGRTTTYETGAVLWDDPFSIERIQLELTGFQAPSL